MVTKISDNKHEYNQKRILEINEVILEKEKSLSTTTKFFQRYGLKKQIKKLYRQIELHGKEVLDYEWSKQN